MVPPKRLYNSMGMESGTFKNMACSHACLRLSSSIHHSNLPNFGGSAGYNQLLSISQLNCEFPEKKHENIQVNSSTQPGTSTNQLI